MDSRENRARNPPALNTPTPLPRLPFIRSERRQRPLHVPRIIHPYPLRVNAIRAEVLSTCVPKIE